MKKLMLAIITISLIVFSSSGFSDIKRLEYPFTYFGGAEELLVNTATDKNPADTLLVDFTNYSDFLDAGSMIIYFQMDTLAGLYGGQSADSLGRNAVRIRYQPIVEYPRQQQLWDRIFINSTIGETGTDYALELVTITDSVTVTGDLVEFIVPIRYQQYYVIIDHAYDDTSNINPQAKTEYEGLIRIRKLNVYQGFASGILGPIDTAGSGTGNKYEADTIKINLLGYNLDGYFEGKFKFDTTGTANTQGRVPSIKIGWGYWDYSDGEQVFHPDSTSAEIYVLEDSVKRYDGWIRFGWDELPIENTEAVFIVVTNSEIDTSTVAYDRAINWYIEHIGR